MPDGSTERGTLGALVPPTTARKRFRQRWVSPLLRRILLVNGQAERLFGYQRIELVGELVVFPTEVAYVQTEPAEHEGEWVFECVIEGENAREVAYHFVMAHEYEVVEHKTEKWTH